MWPSFCCASVRKHERMTCTASCITWMCLILLGSLLPMRGEGHAQRRALLSGRKIRLMPNFRTLGDNNHE